MHIFRLSTDFSTFQIFRISPNLYFDRLLLLKVCKISAKKIQRSYVPWHWRAIQNLKKNRFVVSKMTRIWWIFIQVLNSRKNLHFDWSLLCKVCNIWPKKSTEELSFMTLKCHAKFEEKLTCGLENDMRNLANFYQNLGRVKIRTLMGSFCPK